MNRPLIYVTGQELHKLFQGGKTKALLAVSFAIGVLFVLGAAYLGLDENVARIALELSLPVLLPLFMVSLGSELTVNECKDGTIKNMLRLPLSRESLYMGKVFAGWIAGAMIVLCLFAPAFLGGLLLEGLPTLSSLGASVAEAAGAVLYCGLLAILANSVALWTGSGGTGLAACIGLWMAMNVSSWFAPNVGRYFVTDYADWLQPLLRGGDAGATVTMLLFMIAYYIIGIIWGLLAFQRKGR